MKKGMNFLELIFAAFVVLHFAQVEPFAGWNWFAIISPLLLAMFARLVNLVWAAYGFDKMVYEIVEMSAYDLKLKKQVKKFKKENEEQLKNKKA